jgi:hypothetical protein
MLTLSLGLGVAFSDAKDWTVVRKTMAIVWLLALDALIIVTSINL